MTKKKTFFKPIEEKKETKKCIYVDKCPDYPKLCSQCKENPNKGWYEIRRGYFTPDESEIEDLFKEFRFPRFPRLRYWFPYEIRELQQ